MRIIAGEFRGRKLLPPERTGTTRPITDRVKQSIFDILAPLIPEAVVYDCFAGTGSMGLECLSRGAAQVTFFESDRSALARLRRNIEALKVQRRATVVAGDLFERLSAGAAGRKADLIFLDPPYRYVRERAGDLQRLAERLARDHLASGGTVVVRHDAADVLQLPPLRAYDTRRYGNMAVELLKGAVDWRAAGG